MLENALSIPNYHMPLVSAYFTPGLVTVLPFHLTFLVVVYIWFNDATFRLRAYGQLEKYRDF